MRVTAAVVLLLFALTASVIVLRSPDGYAQQDREQISAGASGQHWTGTDDLGRDRTSRIALAFLIGLAGAVLAAGVTSSIAFAIGVTAAFALPAVGKLLNFAVDFFLTLPWLFLLMMVRSALPLNLSQLQSAFVTFLLLALLGWPVFARINFARAAAIRRSGWMLQARAAGIATSRIALRHALPHLRPLLLTQFLIYIPVCLATEANLGTMGLGIEEPLPSWGSMSAALGRSAVLATSHWVYLPVALLVVVLLLLDSLVFEDRA